MPNEPRLLLLCGLPFAGKTTLARALVERLDLEHVELDRVNTERGLGLGGQPISPADWDETYRQAHDRLARALASGRSAVFDATSFTREQRDALRRIATAAGAATTTIHVDVPFAEARRRWQANRLRPRRFDVRDEDFRLVAERFEPPNDDEAPVSYDGTQPPDAWLEQLSLRDLGGGRYSVSRKAPPPGSVPRAG